ncbi:FAD-dependent oxidoreductase [Candidatus Bipolaricaulota bacterium]|nr:FAD-dependent oxidoreductase [Candidatus Bipolaricaulota bacterium]
MEEYSYIIVGSGLAGVSAIKGIRSVDKSGTILMVGEEVDFPYNRPPLSKDLLLENKTVDDIYIEDENFYEEQGVEMELGTKIVDLDPEAKSIQSDNGATYTYSKLLLATGGYPRKLDIPGGKLKGVLYYRYLSDYRNLDEQLEVSDHVVVVGGGFIGSELAAGLTANDVGVSMVFPENYLLERIFPEELAETVQQDYRHRGVEIINGDVPNSIVNEDSNYLVETSEGRSLEGDLVIVGIGISPSVELAKKGDLDVSDGIGVDRYLQTTDPNIYAAGDVAYFPYTALGNLTRIEHWDHAIKQGKNAGRNMAGSGEVYDYLPYFFSDLFDYGFEAVGEVDSSLDTYIDWKEEGKKGAIYYLSEEGSVRGVLLLGLWGKKKAARKLITEQKTFTKIELEGKIG